MEFIDLKTQYASIKEDIHARIRAVLNHGVYVAGPEIGELEERLAQYIGVKHCIAVSSGTDALLIALMAFGVRAGDEIITTPFSFIATAEVIALLGAKPVFVDIDPRTYNLDPALIEGALTPKTKAIMPVSLYGQCADFDAINAIAARHGLPVIEDAAQSFGASYKGKKSCALSTIGCTSFFPSKPLGGYGDSGACFTDDDALAKKMREIRNHGQDRRYHHPMIGLNGRMDTLQAAILLAKFGLFPAAVDARARVGARYSALLSDRRDSSGRVTVPHVEPYNTSVYAQYTVQVDEREDVSEHLRKKGIPTAVHYAVPLHLQPAFAGLGLATNSLPIAEAVAKRVLCLPMHPYLDHETQDSIVTEVAMAMIQTVVVSEGN